MAYIGRRLRTNKSVNVLQGSKSHLVCVPIVVARQAVAASQEAFAGYYRKIVRAVNAKRPASKRMREADTAQALANLMNGALVAAKLKDDPKEILNALPAAKQLAGL